MSVFYSDIVPISRAGAENIFCSVPNPAIDIISVVLTANNSERKLRLLNSKGPLVKTIVAPP